MKLIFSLLATVVIATSFGQKTAEQAKGVDRNDGRRILIRPVTLPAPVQLFPTNNAIVSAGPAFRVRADLSPIQNVTYDVEVARAGFSRIISSASVPSNANVDIAIPYDNGILQGVYTWRTRIRTSLETGPWSATRTLTANGGVDRLGTTTVAQFQAIRADGWDSHYQSCWNGRTTWSTTRPNLLNANAAGMKLGAYCVLNFDDSSTISGAPAIQTGAWQVDQALANCGFNFAVGKSSLGFNLTYFMIDVERYWGDSTIDERVERIAQALQRARNLGFNVMVYTRNEGVSNWWQVYLGNATDFGDVPLWNTSPELVTNIQRDDLMIVKGAPYIPYGGWTEPAGKQFLLDTTVWGLQIDLNTWRPGTWDVAQPNPGSPILNYDVVPTYVSPNTYEFTVSVTNTGTVPAYGVRVTDIQVGEVSTSNRLILQSVPNAGQKTGRVTMTVPGRGGTRHLFQCNIRTGFGVFPFSKIIVLPNPRN